MGRIIIELRQDLAPNAKENFHSLCTNVKKAGANGQSVVYKGANYDEYQRLLTIPDGHLVVVNDEANGICIYRSHFDDIENPTPQVPVNFIYLKFEISFCHFTKIEQFHFFVLLIL